MRQKKLIIVCFCGISAILLVQHSLYMNCSGMPLDSKPLIFIVTPTFPRPSQLADMTRLCNTVRHLELIYWVVVDDSNAESRELQKLLEFCGVPFAYFNKKTPKQFANGKKYGRGIDNRNAALSWIRNHSEIITAGRPSIIYFADDDNAYDIRLFDEIRKTKKISMFPVGCIARTGLSTPVLHKNGSLIGYHDPFYANRKFPIDMAGFAIGANLVLNSSVQFQRKTGYLEDGFLKSLDFNMSEIQFLAANCTRILVWHVKTVPASPIQRNQVVKTLAGNVKDTNLEELFRTYA